MTIRARLEEARVLARAELREGSFILVLIAAAATSRKRYADHKWDDSEAFKNFIYDELGVITNAFKYNVKFPFQGRDTPLEDIFYSHLRCHLVHEGAMPRSVIFTEPFKENGKTLGTVVLKDPFGFPIAWVENLATAVWLSPENDDLWQDELKERELARTRLGEKWERHLYCRRPNQASKEMKRQRKHLTWEHEGGHYVVTSPFATTSKELLNALDAISSEIRANL